MEAVVAVTWEYGHIVIQWVSNETDWAEAIITSKFGPLLFLYSGRLIDKRVGHDALKEVRIGEHEAGDRVEDHDNDAHVAIEQAKDHSQNEGLVILET